MAQVTRAFSKDADAALKELKAMEKQFVATGDEADGLKVQLALADLAIGAGAGLIGGATQAFQKKDDAFKSYVQEAAEGHLKVGGSRPRTAMALTGDKLILYCTDSPTTPEKLRAELYTLGAETALMLDSGGSSQCDFQGETVNSSRRVNNYLAVWLKKNKEEEPNMSKKVVLDPGHGVETAGKRSPDGTYLEHEFALDMAKRIKPILERHGVAVTLTRTDERDVSLAKRVQIANTVAGLNVFVSLHSNAAGSGSQWMGARGYGVYTSAAGAAAGRNLAANKILARAREAGLSLWGDGLHHNISLYVLKNTTAPAVLIEHLFHDNREDVALLKDSAFRDRLAQVDAKGILDYLGIVWEAVDKPQEGGIACPHCGEALKIEKG